MRSYDAPATRAAPSESPPTDAQLRRQASENMKAAIAKREATPPDKRWRYRTPELIALPSLWQPRVPMHQWPDEVRRVIDERLRSLTGPELEEGMYKSLDDGNYMTAMLIAQEGKRRVGRWRS